MSLMNIVNKFKALSNQKGFAHILLLGVIVAGLAVAVYVVGIETKIFPKAAEFKQSVSGPVPVCQKGLNTFSLEQPCPGSDLYKQASYTCFGGKGGVVGNSTCQTPAKLQMLAKQACKGQSNCPLPTSTPVNLGSCTIRDAYTTLPVYSAPSLGNGYAQISLGQVKDLADAKARCTDAIFNALMTNYCSVNNRPAQWGVAFHTNPNSLTGTSSTCAASGCNNHVCPTSSPTPTSTPTPIPTLTGTGQGTFGFTVGTYSLPINGTVTVDQQNKMITLSCKQGVAGCAFSAVYRARNRTTSNLYHLAMWVANPSGISNLLRFNGFDGIMTNGRSELDRMVEPGQEAINTAIRVEAQQNLGTALAYMYSDGKICISPANPQSCTYNGGSSFTIKVVVSP